jgi:site-specific DNA recombinase
VHWIINNPTYAGRIRWRDRLFDGVHEPLVDEVTFQRALAILRERGEDISRRRGNASDFLLSGVVRCGSCGKAYVGMSARGNGGRYQYYACSGRQKHGPKTCRNERLPRHRLEHAVLQQLASLYRDSDLAAEALAKGEKEAVRARPEIEQRLASIGAEIARAEHALERYYEAFEQGKLSPERCDERLSRLQARLEDLRAQQADLSLSTAHEAGHGPTPADLAAVADELERVVAESEPQKAKALLRLLIQELRVDGRARIQPTYRLITPEVCATSEKVGRAGIEPATLGLRVPCSTS